MVRRTCVISRHGVIHFLFLKLRRVIQAVLIIFSAMIFVTDIFLLEKFSVPLNLDTLQILLGTNPLTAKAFLQSYILNFKILGGLMIFILSLAALSFGLKKIFSGRSEKRLHRLAFDLMIILLLPLTIFIYEATHSLFDATDNLFRNTRTGCAIHDVLCLIHTAPIGNEEKIFKEMDKQLETEKILSDESNIPNVVFILGESTDRNHMQLYGYNLATISYNLAVESKPSWNFRQL